jgi:hypothetical protein
MPALKIINNVQYEYLYNFEVSLCIFLGLLAFLTGDSAKNLRTWRVTNSNNFSISKIGKFQNFRMNINCSVIKVGVITLNKFTPEIVLVKYLTLKD